MIKCYAIKQKSVYEFFAHEEQQEEASEIIGLLTSVEKLEGYFQTPAELEQFAREAFIAGETSLTTCGTYTGCGCLQQTFAEYWAEKKKLLEKNVNEEME